MYETEFVWAVKSSTDTAHVINSDLPKTLVPDDEGVTEKTVTICGTTASGGYHRFQGFENHRGLDFCDGCKRIINQRGDDV